MTNSTDQEHSTSRTGDSPAALEEQAQDWLLTVTDPDVTQEQLAAFETWCLRSPAHQQAYDEASQLWRDAEHLRPLFAPQDEVTAESPPAVKQAYRPAPNRSLRVPAFGAVFIACCLVLVLGTDILTFWQADYRTGVGEQASITLPDGSLAHLNTDSAIAVDYTGERRIVTLLHGEALFEVSKNPQRPFSVLALGGSATALGTAFIVKQENDSIRVSVTEGTVGVASPATDTATQPSGGNNSGNNRSNDSSQVVLTAGQQLSYRQGVVPGSVQDIDAEHLGAWRRGAIIIDNLSLSEALAEVDRYRRGRIVLMAGAAELERVTARLSLDNIDNGLDALAATHNLSVTRVTDYLLIIH